MEYNGKLKVDTPKQVGEFEVHIESILIRDSELQYVIKKSLLANGFKVKSKLILDNDLRVRAEELEITRIEKMYY